MDGLTLGAVYALIALGYTLVYGVLRLINFAHSEIFMIGVFSSLFAFHALGINDADPAKTGAVLVVTLVFAVMVSMAASGFAALAMERIAYRPLRRRNAPRLAALITAIGISLFLQELFAVRYGRDQLAYPRVLAKHQVFQIGGANVRTDKILILLASFVLMIALDRFIARSRLGRGIRATAQDAETAALMGVNIDRVIMLTFFIGGILAGAAGMLYAVFFETVKYDIGFIPGIKAFTAAVLGGIGNVRGALVGGLALGLLEQWGATVLGGQWKDVFAFAVLVLVLMLRPTGLLGEALGRSRA
jgi:branched-chain amino acid transport system permease protein